MSKLRTYRISIEKTQAELAEMLGLSQSFVSKMESGAQLPPLDLAVRIERMTKGAVPAASWIDDAEAATATAGIGE